MSNSIELPEDLYQRAAELAAKDRVSVDELVASVLSTGVAGREYIRSRAKLFTQEEFERALNSVPDVEPDENDRV